MCHNIVAWVAHDSLAPRKLRLRVSDGSKLRVSRPTPSYSTRVFFICMHVIEQMPSVSLVIRDTTITQSITYLSKLLLLLLLECNLPYSLETFMAFFNKY